MSEEIVVASAITRRLRGDYAHARSSGDGWREVMANAAVLFTVLKWREASDEHDLTPRRRLKARNSSAR